MSQAQVLLHDLGSFVDEAAAVRMVAEAGPGRRFRSKSNRFWSVFWDFCGETLFVSFCFSGEGFERMVRIVVGDIWSVLKWVTWVNTQADEIFIFSRMISKEVPLSKHVKAMFCLTTRP